MLDHVSGISGKREMDGDKWIVSEFCQGTEIIRYPALGVCVAFCPVAPRDIHFDYLHTDFSLTRVIGETLIGITHEAHYGLLVF